MEKLLTDPAEVPRYLSSLGLKRILRYIIVLACLFDVNRCSELRMNGLILTRLECKTKIIGSQYLAIPDQASKHRLMNGSAKQNQNSFAAYFLPLFSASWAVAAFCCSFCLSFHRTLLVYRRNFRLQWPLLNPLRCSFFRVRSEIK